MGSILERTSYADSIDPKMPLTSLKPENLLEKLDLSGPGLEEACRAADAGDRPGALDALLEYYRLKYRQDASRPGGSDLERAEKICRRIFQWGPYEEAQYGPDMDWEWDPGDDIEWVAAIYRFYWALPLANAFASTHDEKYARAFVELTADWLSKHRLETHTRAHRVYTGWNGFAWLDIQTGIRATNICSAFRKLVHADAFTPEFLELLMAGLYDHQVKTRLIPMGVIHNKAVFEQRGFINVCDTFREFAEVREWMELAVSRAEENLLAQTTPDGVQREWSYGYHGGVMSDAVEIMERMKSFDMPAPEAFKERVRLMHDYPFWIASPDLGAPMFGDASRPLKAGEDRSKWQLYSTLTGASELLGDPKYAARAELDRDKLPQPGSHAFKKAGMYVMRSGWGPDQIHLALHCSPPAISGHDQPDNGTFELWAYGRWLMPDTGFYTYGHDADARNWHRQTSVHQTLTLDGRDTADAGRHLLWAAEGAETEILTVENGSYDGLAHRRTVWFVARRFFVLLDEAIGESSGRADLHFQFAPGDVAFEGRRAYTRFDDANVLVQAAENIPVSIEEEEGWFAWGYGRRMRRKAMRFEHAGEPPLAFLTLLAPYRGAAVPDAGCLLPAGFSPGQERVELEVSAFGEKWNLVRDLADN